MMATVTAEIVPFPATVAGSGVPAFLSPADMAQRLRMIHSSDARCFAASMHEGAAWASDDWAEYWADVLRQV